MPQVFRCDGCVQLTETAFVHRKDVRCLYRYGKHYIVKCKDGAEFTIKRMYVEAALIRGVPVVDRAADRYPHGLKPAQADSDSTD